MAIDVGSSCIDRAITQNPTYTIINYNNAANATGTIDYVCIYMQTGMTDVDVASFIDEGGGVFSTNGVAQDIGDRAAGQQEYNAPGDFSAFAISVGEFIGCYASAGFVERDNVGNGVYYEPNIDDNIPCSSTSFTLIGGRTISLYATGVEAVAGNPWWYYEMMRRQ